MVRGREKDIEIVKERERAGKMRAGSLGESEVERETESQTNRRLDLQTIRHKLVVYAKAFLYPKKST